MEWLAEVDWISGFSPLGLSEAMVVILGTLLLRLAILPLSLRSAKTQQLNQVRIQALKPELDQLKQRYGDDGKRLAQETMALYRRRGVSLFGRVTLLNMVAQAGVGLTVLHILNQLRFSSGFLWIENISKADWVTALIVGLVTFATMWLAPSGADAHWLMMVLPAVLIAAMLLSQPAVFGLSWGTSSLVGLFQSFYLRRSLAKMQQVSSQSL